VIRSPLPVTHHGGSFLLGSGFDQGSSVCKTLLPGFGVLFRAFVPDTVPAWRRSMVIDLFPF